MARNDGRRIELKIREGRSGDGAAAAAAAAAATLIYRSALPIGGKKLLVEHGPNDI